MAVSRWLLQRFLQIWPYQPATALWRAIEVGHILSRPFPCGFGLDIGCGDGELTKLLIEAAGGREMVGIDLDHNEITMAQATGVYKCVHCASAAAIPEAERSFDFVFSNSVLEHIEDIEAAIGEIARVLRPGGVFLFTVPAKGFHDCLAGPCGRRVSRREYLKDLDRRLVHKRYWSVEECQAVLSRFNLEIVYSSQYLTQSEVRRWEFISNATAGILFALWGKEKSAFEIVHQLGLRQTRQRFPAILARPLAEVIAAGLPETQEEKKTELYACLMVEARLRA